MSWYVVGFFAASFFLLLFILYQAYNIGRVNESLRRERDALRAANKAMKDANKAHKKIDKRTSGDLINDRKRLRDYFTKDS